MAHIIEHKLTPDGRKCACGARFGSPRDLRRHIAKKTEKKHVIDAMGNHV